MQKKTKRQKAKGKIKSAGAVRSCATAASVVDTFDFCLLPFAF
jgi:hypothetical protein